VDGWNIGTDAAMERVELYAADGRLVRKIEGLNTTNFWLEASELPAGMYVVQVRIGGHVIAQRMALVR